MNTIKLMISRGKWLARFEGPFAQSIVNKYGTCEVEVPSKLTVGEISEYIGIIFPGFTIITEPCQH